jgi:hypothetical protein
MALQLDSIRLRTLSLCPLQYRLQGAGFPVQYTYKNSSVPFQGFVLYLK